MKIKTSELTGAPLDWAVAKAANIPIEIVGPDLWLLEYFSGEHPMWFPSNNWAQGGPIIDREKIMVQRLFFSDGGFYAHWWEKGAYSQDVAEERGKYHMVYASDYLVAAMRCFVTSKLGAEIDIPEELL